MHQLRQRFNLWTFTLPAVVILVLGSVAYGLGAVISQLNYGTLLSISLLSMLMAWLLASTRIRTAFAILLSLCIGFPFVLIRAGGLESELTTSLKTLFNFLTGGQGSSFSKALIQTPFQELGTGIGILLDRGRDWLAAVLSGNPIFDPIVTVLVWGFTMWMASFWAGWVVQRTKRPLLGILPAGVMLSITLSYMLAETSSILVFLGATLFLFGVIQHQSLEKRWRQEKVKFYPDVRNNSLLFGAVISLALIVLAAITPSITVQDIVEFGQRWTSSPSGQADEVAESLGLSSKPRRERTAMDNVRFGGLPQEQLIGSGPELNEKIVMQIRSLDEQPVGEPPMYYWRSVTYDKYTGSGWLTSGTNTEIYGADQLVTSTKASFQRIFTQEVEVIGFAKRLLYYPGTLLSVDQEFLLSQRSNQDIFGASVDAEAYTVQSLISTFNEDALGRAGNDYPEWIQNRYLSLPENLPQRVRDLAQELTATIQTPYDRALAIESYLRSFPYSLQVPPTSRYRDIADHFLFDLKRGYCGYYATTMVVMARAAGLPARIVVGYASNNYDEESGAYIITQADAHAWVEVYFPGYEWVEFEPTPNRPLIPRLRQMSTDEIPTREEIGGASRLFNFGALPVNLTLRKIISGSLYLIGYSILGSILVVITWIAMDVLKLRLMAPSKVIESLYKRLKRHARRLGVPYQEGNTPYEFATIFTKHLNEHYRRGAPLTEILQPIQFLINQFMQVNYSPHPPNPDEIGMVLRSWGFIRWNLSLFWLQGMISHWREQVLRRRLFTRASNNS